jgi:hypothetical protein
MARVAWFLGLVVGVKESWRRGFFLPMLILAVLAMGLLAVTMWFMGSNYANQVLHVDEGSRTLMIAEAKVGEMLARIRERPYRERFFAPTPFQELDAEMLGGRCDTFVEDAPPPAVDQADVYVRATWGRARRLYVWRFKHEETLFDAVGRLLPIFFVSLDASDFPRPGHSPFAAALRDLIAVRGANEGNAALTAQSSLKQDDLPALLGELKAYPPGMPIPAVVGSPPGQPPQMPPTLPPIPAFPPAGGSPPTPTPPPPPVPGPPPAGPDPTDPLAGPTWPINQPPPPTDDVVAWEYHRPGSHWTYPVNMITVYDPSWFNVDKALVAARFGGVVANSNPLRRSGARN